MRDPTWEIYDDAHEMMSEHQMQAGRECNATINAVDTAWRRPATPTDEAAADGCTKVSEVAVCPCET